MTMMQTRPPMNRPAQQQQNGAALMKRPVGSAKGLEQLLRASQAKIDRVIAKHMTADRLIQIAGVAMSRVPQLANCTQISLLTSVMKAAELGLDCSGTLGSAYLVPFGQECQLIIGYRGLIELARRSGQIKSIEARVVYQNDEFDLSHGLTPTLVHRPALDVEPGPFRLVYAIAHLVDGGVQTEVMVKSAVDAIRSKSRAGKSGPWVDHYEEMARKTVIKRLAKYLPLTIDVQERIAEDDRREYIDAEPVAKGRNLGVPLDEAPADPDAHQLPADDGDSQLPVEEVAQRVVDGADRRDEPIDAEVVDEPAAEPGSDAVVDEETGEEMTAADLANWSDADKILADRARDMGLSRVAYGSVKTAALGIKYAESTPDQRLKLFHDIVSGAFDKDGKRKPAAPSAS